MKKTKERSEPIIFREKKISETVARKNLPVTLAVQ